MQQKDLSEKVLEDNNDIFADIVNVLLFDGEDTVEESSLVNTTVHSQYKDDSGKYCISSNLAITPFFIGKRISTFSGAFSYILYASFPTEKIYFLSFMAITFFSRQIRTFFLSKILISYVPRSSPYIFLAILKPTP